MSEDDARKALGEEPQWVKFDAAGGRAYVNAARVAYVEESTKLDPACVARCRLDVAFVLADPRTALTAASF